MSNKRIPFWGRLLKAYLAFENLTLGYHTDLQNQSHLGVLHHDPGKKQQVGFFVFPGTQMDLYDPVPLVGRDMFTLMRVNQLWEGLNGRIWLVKPSWLVPIWKTIRRLKRYERCVALLEREGLYLARTAYGPVAWGVVTKDPERNIWVTEMAFFFRHTVDSAEGIKPLDLTALISWDIPSRELRSAVNRLKRHLRQMESRKAKSS